ncbi:MAG: hypothetical protein WCI71_02255 [Bacteroidota bacterium]
MNTTETKSVPDFAVIHVRYYGGTYIARASGLGITASCTSHDEAAVNVCASKIYGRDKFNLQLSGVKIWLAKPKEEEKTCQK